MKMMISTSDPTTSQDVMVAMNFCSTLMSRRMTTSATTLREASWKRAQFSSGLTYPFRVRAYLTGSRTVTTKL